MTLVELQRTLTTVEPAAVLVPPRVMETVIRQVLKLSAMVWSVPHAQSWVVDRTLLFRHVDQADLVLANDQVLPATVILLSWPSEEDLQRQSREAIHLRVWRQLFHQLVHQAMERRWDEEVLTQARLRDLIEQIGPTAFEEIRGVLRGENILTADAKVRTTFNEFVATFLELYHFSPTLLASYFPGLSDPLAVKALLDREVDSDSLMRRTRLPDSLDPVVRKEDTTSEANEYFRALEESGQRALFAGNMVKAAIQIQRATRVAPADQSQKTRRSAERILQDLVQHLRAPLELPDDEVVGWNRLLPILLDKADQGSRPPEAAFLHDLQNIRLDHEREMYKLDLVEYVLSLGRRPLRRPLPSQRLVRIARTLRGVAPKLTAARLSDTDRRELEDLVQKSLVRCEDRVRNRFRPLVNNALQDVGLAAHNPLEAVAFAKMVEEILDRIIDSGFLTFSDLRDTISRNQLKLPDLAEPQDFIRGDPLIRLDRRFATVLDGVYRPGEFYLTLLERFTSLNFGTKIGRAFTRIFTIPVGGAFVIVQGLIRVSQHIPGLDAGANAIDKSNWRYGLWAVVSLLIFGLLHSARMRTNFANAGLAVGRGLRRTLVDVPLWVARHQALHRFLTSTPFQLFYWYGVKPAALTGAAILLMSRFDKLPKIVGDENGAIPTIVTFLAANFVINSRPGEIVWGGLLNVLQAFFNLLHAGLLPALVRFIERVYKQIMHSIESGLFLVDEWLRFRGGESRATTALRTVATLIWMPISYLARFNIVVLIEPCFHPLKFPVVTVATKLYLPLIPVIQPVLFSWFNEIFPNPIATGIVWWLIFWLPDAVGFVFWEMKENWSLFRANRRSTVSPALVGSHGETIGGYFLPGFHSGTLPKLFAKIRHAEERALHSGNYSAVRNYRGILGKVEATLLHFIEREFCTLLKQSPVWRDRPLAASGVELSSNRVRFRLDHPGHPDAPLRLDFENRAGWIVAEIGAPAWLTSLPRDAETDLHNALILLYKMCGVDLICEQIRSLLPSRDDRFDFNSTGLSIWPADGQGKELRIDLRPDVAPHNQAEIEAAVSILAWDPRRVVFSSHPLTRVECLLSWPANRAAGSIPERLLPDVSVIPPATNEAGRESAA